MEKSRKGKRKAFEEIMTDHNPQILETKQTSVKKSIVPFIRKVCKKQIYRHI